MKEEILNEIVERFIDLYKEEIGNGNVTPDSINEWWEYTSYQYGYDAEESSKVYPDVEEAIWSQIKKLRKTYIISGGGQYIQQRVEYGMPVEYTVRLTDWAYESGVGGQSFYANTIWGLSFDDLMNFIKDWTDEDVELIEVDEE